MDRHSME
jgi:hypothetical protein